MVRLRYCWYYFWLPFKSFKWTFLVSRKHMLTFVCITSYHLCTSGTTTMDRGKSSGFKVTHHYIILQPSGWETGYSISSLLRWFYSQTFLLCSYTPVRFEVLFFVFSTMHCPTFICFCLFFPWARIQRALWTFYCNLQQSDN